MDLLDSVRRFDQTQQKSVYTAEGLRRSPNVPFASAVNALAHPSRSLFEPGTGLNRHALFQHSSFKTQGQRQTSADTISLDEAFQILKESEELDEENQWFRPHCRNFVCAAKTMSLWTTPELLVIHLKRFAQGISYVHKDEREVIIPDVLDLQPYIERPHSDDGALYRLYAVSNHGGWINAGHYTADCLMKGETEEWYEFDDSRVAKITEAAVHTSSAYLLFYEWVH